MTPVYQRILAAVDLERPADNPLVTGVRLAAEHKADLRLVAVVRTALLLAKGFFNPKLVERQELVDEARAALRARAQHYCNNPIPSDVLVGDPGEVIADAAENRVCDLIVIGARVRSASERLLGTTATEVLRHAHGIDIYVCHRDDPQSRTEKVLIAIDGSANTPDLLAESARFLAGAAAHTSARDAQVVCVVPRDRGSRSDRLLKKCEDYLKASPWQSEALRLEMGDVTDNLDSIIREHDTDLLIIGSGRTAGLAWAAGSTTNSVLHEVSCDVLVLRQ